jgi:uncharacterized lipoprotein YddW (UPF0748 family)
MSRRLFGLLPVIVMVIAYLATALFATSQDENDIYSYLPIVFVAEATPTPTPTPIPEPAMVEFRGLWVSRFDWTLPGQPASQAQAKIDEIVNNAAFAGFNAILFQVRGEADAFYTPGLEPWSRRLTGTLGQHPGWDPLQYLLNKAQAQGIQVHAYLNVYTVWTGCTPPPGGTNPLHLYHQLAAQGTTNGKLNHLQWNSSDQQLCSEYMWASPASLRVDDHIMDVAADLVSRYNLDGIHLDRVRYAGSTTSCDPVSQSRSGVRCFTSPPANYASYGDWQRAQVNGTVGKFYNQIIPLKPSMWLSAAVWFNYNTGRNSYFQDSKAWAQGSYIDALMPMIYPVTQCPNSTDPYWSQPNWQAITADFQATSGGRYVIPGIGGAYCTFDEIEARINAARAVGTAGHAIFSYKGLHDRQFFDDLRNGPYATPAAVPVLPWRP